MADVFHPLNIFSEIDIYRMNLPHWRQDDVTYFVTWRLADALPQSKLREWEDERSSWLRAHHLQTKDQIVNLPDDQRNEYHRLFTTRLHQWLDAGAGSCSLRQSSCSQIVGDALCHFDGQRYTLDHFVIMPNHVHAILSPNGKWRLDQILHSWKSFTGTALNQKLGRHGVFWQDETWDHIVRSLAQLEHFRNYIRDNPVKARLREGEFILGCGTGLEIPD